MSLSSISQKSNLTPEQLIILDSELEKNKPSKLVTYILWLFSGCGIFAFHRIYNHDYKNAILMIISMGGFMIWGLTDIFRIDSICQKRIEYLEKAIIQDIEMMANAKQKNIIIQKI